MKKFLAVLVLFLVAVSFIACPPPKSEITISSPTEAQLLKFGDTMTISFEVTGSISKVDIKLFAEGIDIAAADISSEYDSADGEFPT